MKKKNFESWELEFNDNIKCPYFGHEHDVYEDDYHEILTGDGDEHEILCTECEEWFYVYPSVSWSFTTVAK